MHVWYFWTRVTGLLIRCDMFSLENPHESELRQKLELLGDPDRILANPWHNEHGLNQREDVDHCQWTAWVPIPFGHGSPWEASAQSLGDFHTESKHWHMVWMLQFLIMVCEDHDLGTPSFQIDQHRNRRLWKRLIRAYVMNVYFNDRSKPTQDLLEMFLRRSPKFDPAVTEMIEEMRRTIEKERSRENDSGGSANNGDANDTSGVSPDMLGQLPARLPTESAQDYQLRIEQQRVQDEVRQMQEEMAQRVQELLQQHPDWTPQQAQAQAQEEMNQQNDDELDALFDDMETNDFGQDAAEGTFAEGTSGGDAGGTLGEGTYNDVEGIEDVQAMDLDNDMDQIVAEEQQHAAQLDPRGGANNDTTGDTSGIDRVTARQIAREQLSMRQAQERRVEEWASTLPPLCVFQAYGGRLASIEMSLTEQRHALVDGLRDVGLRVDRLPYLRHIAHHVPTTATPLIWPLAPCQRPPVPDVADLLDDDGLERTMRDQDVFARFSDAENKVTVKLYVFDGEEPGERHCLMGFAFRDQIEINRLVNKIQAAQKQRKAREQNGKKRGYHQWQDPYNQLLRYRTFHPAFTYSTDMYIAVCHWFYGGVTDKRQENRTGISFDAFSHKNAYYHPRRVCTLDRALNRLRQCGAKLGGLCEADFLSPIQMGNDTPPSTYGDRRGGAGGTFGGGGGGGQAEVNYIYTMHTPPNTTSWTFDPLHVFWYHKHYQGLSQTLLPFRAERDDLSLQLITGQARVDPKLGIVFLSDEQTDDARAYSAGGEGVDKHSRPYDRLAIQDEAYQKQVSMRQVVIDKRQVMRSIPTLLEYRHGDVLVHYEVENRLARRMVDALLPDDPLSDPEGYEVYCKVQDMYRESAMSKFCSIWIVNGIVEHLPTSSTIKAVLLYGSKLLDPKRNPKRLVTCHLNLFDPDMTPYGNSVVSKMMLLGKGAVIINCKIPFLAGGLLTTFDRDRPGKPRANIQLCGPADVGKTFPFLDFIKSNYIAKTWDDQHRASEKSRNTHTHFPPQILLCDEPPKYVTDAKAEERDYEAVQQMKNVMVSGTHTYSVFKMVEFEGREIRTTDDVKTKDPRTMGFCTNQPRDKDHPLGSRFLMVSVPRPTKPPEDYQYEPGKLFPSAVKTFFHIEQFLSTELMSAVRVGPVVDIDMFLFKEVTTRVLCVLRTKNIMDTRKGIRPIQIMEPFVRYETYVRAITCARHIPGGILYNKPYDVRDVYKYGPLMFPTLEIIKMMMRMTIDELVDEDARIVATAFCRYCNYDPAQTALQNFERVYRENLQQSAVNRVQIPWRMHRNPGFKPSDPKCEEPEYLLNINEIRMSGRIENIAQVLMPMCRGLSTVQVTKVLTGLTKRSIRMRNNMRYLNMGEGVLCNVVDGIAVDVTQTQEKKVLDEEEIMIEAGWVSAGSFSNQEDRLGSYYLNPALLWLLEDNAIDDAWFLATMHGKYPRGKFISGRINADHPDIFDVDTLTDEFIVNYCNYHDQCFPNAPLPRIKGIAMNHCAKLTEAEQDVLISRILDPTEGHHAEIFKDICTSRNKAFHEIEDLELYAAQRAAHRAGDRSGIYYTDETVARLYDEYMEAHPETPRPSKDLRYPSNIIKQREAAERQWNHNNEQMTSAHDILGKLSQKNLSFNMSIDDQETMERICKRRKQQQHTPSPDTTPVMRNIPLTPPEMPLASSDASSTLASTLVREQGQEQRRRHGARRINIAVASQVSRAPTQTNARKRTMHTTQNNNQRKRLQQARQAVSQTTHTHVPGQRS